MKQIVITEGQEIALQNAINEISVKKYPINPEKVIIVKKYLDSGFTRGKYDTINAAGYPEIIPVIGMLDSTGQVLRNLNREEMQDLLIDKFKKMFSDKEERDRFIKQVLMDWYNNKIGVFGGLTVNYV